MSEIRSCFFTCLHLAAAAGTLALCSCATNGSREELGKAVAVPVAWQQSGMLPGALDAAGLPMWWKRLNDPVLSELIAAALLASPDVVSARSKIAEYRGLRGIQQAGLFPTLTANVAGGTTHTTAHASTLTTQNDAYSASLDASWQVDLFGLQRQALDAASADLAQTTELYYGVQVSLAADVATAYVALRSAEAQLAVVQNSLGTRLETVQLTQWREQAGVGNTLDTQQALSLLEQTRAAISPLQLTIAQTRNQLTLLAGRPPGALDAALGPAHEVPAPPIQMAIGIPAETLRQRPDVRAAERGVDAAFARTQAARRQRLPALTLTGSLGVQASSAPRLFSPDSTVASLLGGLTAPIFEAGRISQNIVVERERERQSLLAYETTVLTALAEVENALDAVQRHAERLVILGRATAAAREAATLSGLQYQAGQVDLLVSLDAQRTLQTSLQQEVMTAADRANAYIQLYKALGGGWSQL